MTTWKAIARTIRLNRARTTSTTGELAAVVLVIGLVMAVGFVRVLAAAGPAIVVYAVGPAVAARLRFRRAEDRARPSVAIIRHVLTTHLVRAAAIVWLLAVLLASNRPGAIPSVAGALFAGLAAFELPRQLLPMVFGRNARRRRPIRSLLIDQANTLGDVVLSTVSLRAAAGSSPETRVSYLCRDAYAGLLDRHPRIEQVFAESIADGVPKSLARSLSDLLRLRAIVHQARADAVAVLWNRPSPLMPVAAALARVPTRCGFLDREGYGWMFNAGCARPSSPARHQVEHYLECLGSLGVEAAGIPRPSLALDPKDVAEARQMLLDHGVPPDGLLVALSPGTGGSNRSLPPETHARFLHLIRARFGARAVVLGLPDERQLTASIAAASPEGTIDLSGVTTTQLAALISLARVHVGTDSGPGHLAAALGVPCVVIWPAKTSKALRWGPWMVPHVIVRRRASCPLLCVPWTCASDACVRVISAEHLCAAFETVLNGGGATEPQDGRHSWAAASLGVVVHAPDPDRQAESALEVLRLLEAARFVDVSLSCPPGSTLAARVSAAGIDVRGCDAASLADLMVEFAGGVIYDFASRPTLHLRTAQLMTRGWTGHPVHRVPAAPAEQVVTGLTDYLLEAIGGSPRAASARDADR
jgi:ADP-heptose:LPS heptosyltransferase